MVFKYLLIASSLFVIMIILQNRLVFDIYQLQLYGKITTNHETVNISYSGYKYNSSMRDPKQWIGDRNILAYSAYYDERLIIGRPNVAHVVIMGLYKGAHYSNVCTIWYDDSTSFAWNSSILYYVRSIFVVHCPCFNKEYPRYVSLGINSGWRIKVEKPHKPNLEKKNLAICLKEVYDIPGISVDPLKVNFIVEWIELNKILGIDHIIVYNVSMKSSISSVFEHYAKQGYVTIHQRPLTNFDESKPNRKLGLNDCMFRHMHSFRKFINIDSDEFINTYGNETLWEFLQTFHRKANSTRIAFIFRNQRYFTDDIKINPGFLTTQHALYHVEAESERYRPKQIVDSETCVAVTAHSCHIYPHAKLKFFYPEQAVSYHYKSCEKSRKENKPLNCTEAFKSSKLDLSMTKYGAKLAIRVNNALKDIDLNH